MIQALGAGMIPQGDPVAVNAAGLDPRSPMWLVDGKRLLFADSAQIFEWDQARGTVPIYAAKGTLGGLSLGPKVSGNGRQLIAAVDKWNSDIWEVSLDGDGLKATGPPRAVLQSDKSDAHPDYSPDGRMVTFVSDRSGASEVWLANADGSNPRQLTHLGAHIASYPKWSPDGTKIAFHARVPEVAEIYVVDVNQGVPRQITHENPGLALATWSNDGKYLYASTLLGGIGTEYRFAANGGPMERLWEGALAEESVDGEYILYWKTNTPGIFRRSLKGDAAKNPEELLVPDFWPLGQLGGYAPVAGGVYYVSSDGGGKPGPFRYFDYASRKSTDVAPAAPGLGRGFAISPDHRHLAFAASASLGSDLLSLQVQ
jgi:hypothetical protein